MITSDLQLPKFAMTFFTTDYCDSHTNTGKIGFPNEEPPSVIN